MGALWQYRWLVLVLLIAPTIAYCQYRAVERMATERCANAGGTWDEERDECTGLPAPQAQGSEASDEGEEAQDVQATIGPDSPYEVQYVPSDAAAGEAQVDALPVEAGDGSNEGSSERSNDASDDSSSEQSSERTE